MGRGALGEPRELVSTQEGALTRTGERGAASILKSALVGSGGARNWEPGINRRSHLVWGLLCVSLFLPVICCVTLGVTVPSRAFCFICGMTCRSQHLKASVAGARALERGPWSLTTPVQSLAPLFLAV